METICAAILSKPRGVVALGKRFYQQQVLRNTQLHNHADTSFQLELPLAKAYPAGGDVMVENLWYKDAQEGIQVTHFLAVPPFHFLFFPGVQRKAKTSFHPWWRKGFKLKIEESKPSFLLWRETKTTPSWLLKPMPELLPFCNKLLQTSYTPDWQLLTYDYILQFRHARTTCI